MEKNLKQNMAITLIALVITIIILLILATITIVALRNTNLFSKTIDSRNKYKQAEKMENNTLDDYANKINEVADEIATKNNETKATDNTTTDTDKLYLYNYGDTCDDVTGGWDLYSWIDKRSGNTYGDIQFKKDYVEIDDYLNNSSTGMVTQKSQDLSKWNYICAEIVVKSNLIDQYSETFFLLSDKKPAQKSGYNWPNGGNGSDPAIAQSIRGTTYEESLQCTYQPKLNEKLKVKVNIDDLSNKILRNSSFINLAGYYVKTFECYSIWLEK